MISDSSPVFSQRPEAIKEIAADGAAHATWVYFTNIMVTGWNLSTKD